MRSDSSIDETNRSVKASFADKDKGSVRTDAVTQALEGKTDRKIITGYRGVSVLSAFTPLKVGDTTWVLLAEIDEDEVRKPIRNLIIEMGFGHSTGGGDSCVLYRKRDCRSAGQSC